MLLYGWLLLLISLTTFFQIIEGGTFTVDYTTQQFIKDGKPWKYISGSIHYWRIHPDYWEDRLQRVRALGLNAIQMYAAWNIHEPYEGKFEFSGIANISRFLSLAQQNGLPVLFRPGPYIDAEQEYGGLPYWLIKYEKIRMRTMDPNWLRVVQNYYEQLLDAIIPHLYKNGGPVLMIQVENEYGFLGACDHNYTAWLRDLIWSKVGNDTVLYTTNPSSDTILSCGYVPGTVTTVDFGPTNHAAIDEHFRKQDNYSHGSPHVCSEFYNDWFLQWGESNTSGTYRGSNLNNENITQYIDNIDYIHNHWNGSVNLYLVHGGTNFAFYNGDKSSPFGSIITSYWVGSPIAENGDITNIYQKIRDYISGLPNWDNPPLPIPQNNTMANYGQITLKRLGTNLISTLTQIQETCQSSTVPMSFEQLDYPFGYVLYTTTLQIGGTKLATPNILDYGYVYLNNVYQGMILRGLNAWLTLSTKANSGDVLRILVENRGRQDFWNHVDVPGLDSKGLHNGSTLDNNSIQNWIQCGINMTKPSIDRLTQTFFIDDFKESNKILPEKAVSAPSVYAGSFTANNIQDTYLDTSGWGKGQLFVNGYNLGRYWPTYGPQVTLYIPKPFLQQNNTILLIELTGSNVNYVNLIDHPYFVFQNNADPCYDYCKNDGVCYVTSANQPTCLCSPCYTGSTCSSFINLCANQQAQNTCNVGVNGNQCVDLMNSTYCGYACQCGGQTEISSYCN